MAVFISSWHTNNHNTCCACMHVVDSHRQTAQTADGCAQDSILEPQVDISMKVNNNQ